MITFYNHAHVLHQGRTEMFRGQMVPCFEVAARVDHVLSELVGRKLGANGGRAVMAFFATMPYGKFAHGVYRVAALLKWAVERRRPNPLQLAED